MKALPSRTTTCPPHHPGQMALFPHPIVNYNLSAFYFVIGVSTSQLKLWQLRVEIFPVPTALASLKVWVIKGSLR